MPKIFTKLGFSPLHCNKLGKLASWLASPPNWLAYSKSKFRPLGRSTKANNLHTRRNFDQLAGQATKASQPAKRLEDLDETMKATHSDSQTIRARLYSVSTNSYEEVARFAFEWPQVLRLSLGSISIDIRMH